MWRGGLDVTIRVMIRYIISVLILIVASLGVMYFWVGVPRVYEGTRLTPPQLHMYNDESRPIEEISVLVFYFVPRNRLERKIENWKDLLEKNLEELKVFHELQFQNFSHLTYTIYPVPVIGLKEGIEYDTNVTQHGNPEALKRITSELEERILNPQGDLYRRPFIPQGYDPTNLDPYQPLLILYEGVGALGGDNAALVSSTYLADERFNTYGASFLAHEFYHTLGVPDGYDISTAIATEADIMGLGRFKALERTYLGRQTLRFLGIK